MILTLPEEARGEGQPRAEEPERIEMDRRIKRRPRREEREHCFVVAWRRGVAPRRAVAWRGAERSVELVK